VFQDRCYNKDNKNKRSHSKMPIKLSTTVQKIFSLSNKANSLLLSEFYEYMKSNGVSENHQNNNLKVLIAFARYLEPSSFIDIRTSESITDFLNSKLKSIDDFVVVWSLVRIGLIIKYNNILLFPKLSILFQNGLSFKI
jgi:hypothetical protein